jgi:hypothetical protein
MLVPSYILKKKGYGVRLLCLCAIWRSKSKKSRYFFRHSWYFLQRQSSIFLVTGRLSFSLPESTKAILSTLGCQFPSRNFLCWTSKHFRRSKSSSWTTTWSTFQTFTRFNWRWTKKFWSHSSGTSLSFFNVHFVYIM